MGYWIAVVELSTYGTQDNKFSLSFGQVCSHIQDISEGADDAQVFALFVAVPPVIEVTQLLGELWYWFRGITWVRAIAGPPPKRRTDVKNSPIVLPDFVKKDERLQQEELYSDN